MTFEGLKKSSLINEQNRQKNEFFAPNEIKHVL